MSLDRNALRELYGRLESAQQKDRSWQFEGLGNWSVEAIFEKLRDLGVNTDADRFHAQAAEAGDYQPLCNKWVGQVAAEFCETFWLDFPYHAVSELWKRLARDVVCPGLIENDLYEAFTSEDGEKPLPDVEGKPATLAAALNLVAFIRSFPADQQAGLFEKISAADFDIDYVRYLSDLVKARAGDNPEEAGRIMDLLCDCVPLLDASQAHVVIALAALGRREDAARRLEALTGVKNLDASDYLDIGNAHVALGNVDAAIGVWKQGLSISKDEDSWCELVDRIEEILTPLGREDEAIAIADDFPMPEMEETDDDSSEDEDFDDGDEDDARPAVADWEPAARVAPLKAGPKVGRNEPCPCGSGKKYKKCCMP